VQDCDDSIAIEVPPKFLLKSRARLKFLNKIANKKPTQNSNAAIHKIKNETLCKFKSSIYDE
jgi:hypothetical protein